MEAAKVLYSPDKARSFADIVKERSGQNLLSCYQCRRCASGCPVFAETSSFTPNRLIRHIILGDIEKAYNNDLIWKCVSCFTCGARCPNGIHTSRINDALKQMIKEEHRTIRHKNIAYFHSAFVRSVLLWGKLNEAEFMGRYELKYGFDFARRGRMDRFISSEISKLAKFGFRMMYHRRMPLGFHFSSGGLELRRLLKKYRRKHRMNHV